jgi:hypothetical protein
MKLAGAFPRLKRMECFASPGQAPSRKQQHALALSMRFA